MTESSTAWDELILTGVEVFAHHGVYDHERRDGQRFIVDAVLRLDLSGAGGADELAQTVHYGELAQEIAAAVERDPVDLIETLAERVASVILAHPAVVSTTVTVHKPDAPIPVPFADVAVRITRPSPSPKWHNTPNEDFRNGVLRHFGEGEAGVGTRGVVALGANLGDREGTLRAAVAELEGAGVRVVAASPIVQTPALKPEGVDEEAPAYLNAVVAVDTVLSPRALLRRLNDIEHRHGRVRETRWGDRTLDLDLIAYGTARVDDPDLVVPHPRAHERAFVLDPWSRMDPDAELPGRGRVADLLAAVVAASGERVDEYPAEPLLPEPEARP